MGGTTLDGEQGRDRNLESGGGRRGGASRAGRVPAWLPLGVLLAGIAALVLRLDREARARGVARIDVTRYRLHSPDRWTLPVWNSRLERVLLAVDTIDAEDRGAIDELAQRIGALSFVAEVGEPQVRWPDGLDLPLRLRQPIACVRVGGAYLPVADDGMVLAGYSHAPHRAFGGYLPVILPESQGEGDGALPVPGDLLDRPSEQRALAVARSMWAFLDKADRERIGRILIDARSPRAWDGLPGGVVIDLEGARRIHFGRSPLADAPGELPLERKWAHVHEALIRWEAGEDFAAVDVRWDQADWLSAPGEGR